MARSDTEKKNAVRRTEPLGAVLAEEAVVKHVAP